MDHPLYIPRGRERFREPGGPEEWGRRMPLLHRSIADIDEPELVSHVLNDVGYQRTLFNIHGMESKDARILECIDLRHFDKRLAGDIDILVIPAGAPELSTAIQVKRFEAKVRMNAEGRDEVHGGNPERWRKLMAHGIEQANRTKAVGFAHVYLWIFVVIDTRDRNSGWYTYEGPDSSLRSQIHQAISPFGLDASIGLMMFDWVQPMDRAPFELSGSGGHLQRLATRTPQSSDVTARLQTLPTQVLKPQTRFSALR